MNISLELHKKFIETMNKLREKYGEELTKLNGFHNSNLNFTDFIDKFIDSDNVANSTIDGNANVNSKDICSLMAEIDKPHTKLLAYNKIFFELAKKYDVKTAQEWLESEWSGAFYLHDASSASFKPYCFAYDLDELVKRGLFFVNDFKSEAPKHLLTFTRDVLEFVSWTSNRTSGACGLPSFLIYSFYFWKKDVENNYFLKNPEYYRDQGFQEIIYGLNQPYLRVNQSAFTNFTIMDRSYLEEMFGGRVYPDGTYVIDFIDELIEYQKAFMIEVDKTRSHTMFTFPIITFSLLFKDGKFVDEDFARWCSDHNTKWADSNFFVSEDITSLSSCCRLINDFSKINGFINSIGGSALKIGSVKVNTVNLVRIAFESNSEEEYIDLLEKRVTLCIKTLDIIRHIINRNIEKGLLPNYTYGLIELKNQYNTIGINGMYECLDKFGYIDVDKFGNKCYSNKADNFSLKILNCINQIKDSFEKDYSINIECVPAERCASILYQKDKLLGFPVPDITLYANQWIPLDQKCRLDEKIRLGALLDKKCGGGQIAHINIGSKFKDKDQAWGLLLKIANSGVIYFAFNKKLFSCKSGHGFTENICPICGEEKSEEYTRIVGFITPTKAYSKERKIEYQNRKWFNLLDM